MPKRVEAAEQQFKVDIKDAPRISALKTSQRRFGTPPHLLASIDNWKIDCLVRWMKWREQLTESLSESDRLFSARLAVTWAWGRAKDRAACSRGRRERELVARRGYPRSSRLKPRDPIAAFASADKQSAPDLISLELLDQLAVILKIDDTTIQRALAGSVDCKALAKVARKIRSAARGRPGDQLDTGMRGFIQDLALFWWHATGERPDKRSESDSTKQLKFPRFTEVALKDVGAGVGHSRAVREALNQLERDGRAPWK
jgi:hypothetical protein